MMASSEEKVDIALMKEIDPELSNEEAKDQCDKLHSQSIRSTHQLKGVKLEELKQWGIRHGIAVTLLDKYSVLPSAVASTAVLPSAVASTATAISPEQLQLPSMSGIQVVTKEDIESVKEDNREQRKRVREDIESIEKRMVEKLEQLISGLHRESIALSEFSASHIQQIRQHAHMMLKPIDWPPFVSSSSSTSSSSLSPSSIPEFKWSDENEDQQQDRYVQYVKDHLQIPRHLSVKAAPANLLDVSKSARLPFDVKGSSDVMVVERSAGLAPEFGIRMLFELTKAVMRKNLFQAIGELLAADELTAFTPVVVLTDLNEVWTFYWLEGDGGPHLLYSEAPSRYAAFCAIQAFLNSSDKTQSEDAQIPFNKRRKLIDIVREEQRKQKARTDEQAEMEEEDEMGEEEEEDRQLSRQRAIRRMILNTPAFIPYCRPEIVAAYRPPPLYPHDSPPSMYM